MLVFSRKTGETIVIPTSDGTITIKIVKVGESYVRVGIDAPREVKIQRGEIAEESK